MRKTLFEPIEIHDFEAAIFPLPSHRHTYYELVYIRKGSGLHHLNNNVFSYNIGDIFIISPEDQHYFEIKKQTHFTFIKFTDSYFSEHKMHRPDALLLSSPEDIMRNKMLKEVKLKMDEPCVSILRNTVENIVAYNCRNDIASSPLVYYQILSILGLIREAAQKFSIRLDKTNPDKKELISYIHENIYNPELLFAQNIATHFHIAPGYFSAYFKRNFEISYRSYINKYRAKLIEKRLLVPSLSIQEIANEFGFNDISHLNKTFKKYKGVSPSAFKKSIPKLKN
ncbi:helix-turn-helix transcriptional regulator [Flavobacterium sp. J27]|uniref:AraC family transcriptional regulator n=1 Tax=Flavobacterium sp. J27 TaxID=2060419 RepID=UPI0010317730|nr:helix-turn-helix transcriptional regulator [Flavobacterium sp. J27]